MSSVGTQIEALAIRPGDTVVVRVEAAATPDDLGALAMTLRATAECLNVRIVMLPAAGEVEVIPAQLLADLADTVCNRMARITSDDQRARTLTEAFAEHGIALTMPRRP